MSDVETEDLVWACQRFAEIEDFADCDCDCGIDLEDDEQARIFGGFLDAASEQLALLSGNELKGICTSTIEICRPTCSCWGVCSCERDVIYPPVYPIIDVLGVSFTGYDTFVPADFVIVDDVGIAWADNTTPGRWPSMKTIVFQIQWGHRVDQIAKNAALELACAAMRSCITDGSRKVQADSVQRQGFGFQRARVAAEADAAQRAVADHPWMARFLALYNPQRTYSPPEIWAPEFGDAHIIRTL